jgi:hypothetical protein
MIVCVITARSLWDRGNLAYSPRMKANRQLNILVAVAFLPSIKKLI